MTAILALALVLSLVAAPRPASDGSGPVGLYRLDQGRTGAPNLAAGSLRVPLEKPHRKMPEWTEFARVPITGGEGMRKTQASAHANAAKNGAPIASWYDDGPGYYAAAGPALRVEGWRGSEVAVCAERCIRVTLSDWCACYAGTGRERAIDLSREAFALLAPPSRGLVRVTIYPWRTARGLMQ